MDDTLRKHLYKLDYSLLQLALSDSSIEYAPHIRKNFDHVVNDLNRIKEYLGDEPMESDMYF